MLQTSAQIVSTQSLPPEMGDVESNPGPTTHTNKHTPVIWIYDLCHKQINKKQTSIRCNHTHNTHWVHLKCTQIKQRQYKPDCRFTIHTPTQNVTTTLSTDNRTVHHKQTTTHPLTNNNQPKDKNLVILQININGIRNKIEELKKTRTQHPTGHHHNTRNKTRRGLMTLINTIQETKLTQKAKTPKIPPLHHHMHRQRAQTRRGAHHTDQGRHNFHKHKHTQGHQHTQHRPTTDQNIHRQGQRHHSNKHILSTKRHDVTTLQHRGHRHRILHTTGHQHTRLNTHR